MPVGGDDSEVILMQSGFGAVGLLGSKGVVRNGREEGSGGSSSRRRWKQCPGTVCQRRRARSPRGGGPALPGLCWWGPACRAGGGRGRVWTQTLRAAGVRSEGFWWGPGHGHCSEGPGCCEESRRKVNSSGVWRAEPCREAVRKTPLRPAFVNLKGNRFLDQHFTVPQRGWWDLSRVGGVPIKESGRRQGAQNPSWTG